MKHPLSYYSIDWLQLYCIGNFNHDGSPAVQDEMISPNQDKNGYHRTYKFVRAIEYTHGYTWHRQVMWKDYTIAHISAIPSSQLHNPHGCSIKISNAVLYLYDWYFILTDILDTLGWKAQNISRIDLCCDVNYFIGGLLPSTFIRNYTSRKNSYIRVGRKANEWALYGQKDIGGINLNSIRWGSRQSGVSVYLYNKSKELREQKDKPYIRYCWKGAGLNLGKDVWRTEISITSQGCGLKDISSSMLHTLFVDDLRNSEAIKTMFQTYAKKYFHFKRIIQGRKKQDMPDLELHNLDNASVWRPISLQEKRGCGRTERITYNRLSELREYLITQDTVLDPKREEISHIDKVMEYYGFMSGIKHQASAQERSNENNLKASLMYDLNIKNQYDRLHTSMEVRDHIDYYAHVCRNVARKIVSQLAHAGSPQPRRKSERQDSDHLNIY